jgi:predicted Zn-dependent protease
MQSILNELLETEPSLAGKIKIFVTRYSSVNAISLPEGTILLNIGLIASTENESQLAALICHEIAHIKKQHVLANMRKKENIKKRGRKRL